MDLFDFDNKIGTLSINDSEPHDAFAFGAACGHAAVMDKVCKPILKLQSQWNEKFQPSVDQTEEKRKLPPKPLDVEAIWLWEFGESDEGRDYSGRKVLRSRFGQYAHRYGWVVEKINPIGAQLESNLHIVNAATHTDRVGRTEYYDNGVRYRVKRAAHGGYYDYSRKDFCIECRIPTMIWEREFGQKSEGIDFAGRKVERSQFGGTGDGAWNVDHIRPLAKGGGNEFFNMQVASVAVNATKADKLEFSFDGNVYRVEQSRAVTEDEMESTPYDFSKKDFCIVKGAPKR